MKRRGPPKELRDIAARLIKSIANRYYRGYDGDIPLGDLLEFANVGAGDALINWNGTGDFEAYCAWQIVCSIRRRVRRDILRHLPGPKREKVCALNATERAAYSYEDDAGREAPPSLHAHVDLAKHGLLEYRMELAYAYEPLDQSPDLGADPSAQVEDADQRSVLRRAISRLAPPLDVIVARFIYDEWTTEDVAKEVGMSKSAVNRAYLRGRAQVIAELSQGSESAHPSAPP